MKLVLQATKTQVAWNSGIHCLGLPETLQGRFLMIAEAAKGQLHGILWNSEFGRCLHDTWLEV